MLALLCFCVATEFSVNKDLYISVIIRPPRNASIRCGVLLSFGGLYVCLSVCWSQPWAVQKRIDRSRCRLGYELRWDQEPCNRWGSGSPEKGTISAEGTSPDPLYSIRCSSFLKTMSQYRWIYHCRTLPLWQPNFFRIGYGRQYKLAYNYNLHQITKLHCDHHIMPNDTTYRKQARKDKCR